MADHIDHVGKVEVHCDRGNGPRRADTAKERTSLVKLFPSRKYVRVEEFENPG